MKSKLPISVLVAFIAGALLYQVAVVFMGGVLAAIAIPRTYFALFGQHKELALAVLQFVNYALPVALMVAGGTIAIQRLLGCNPNAVLSAVLAGLVLCSVYWIADWVFTPHADLVGEPFQPSTRLMQILASPWWAVSGFLAPWFGFALGVWLVLRKGSA